jgi:prephenate dehydrogenase
MTPIFDRLTLIGLGLIGSSIARAARLKGSPARLWRPMPTRR